MGDALNLPQHLAIIMDGNGRWAKVRGHNRFFGHVRGAKVAKTIVEECARLGVPYLTLFAFSTENWQRPVDEVSFLMRLLVRKLRRERDLLKRENIRFQCIGDIRRLPEYVRNEVLRTIEATHRNTGMVLTFALSYGGRQELTATMRTLAEQIKNGELTPDQITEELISETLPSAFLPDPDLLIRTSGECRISNFLLWQSAYSEIYFESAAWPDFDIPLLHQALNSFAGRERRFGRTGEQVGASS